MSAPKQLDWGGEAARQGGISTIDRSSVKDILYCFALRRLQSLAKVTSQPDPTKLVTMSFEAMLLAIENIAPNPALHLDHVALRGIYAKHCGTLTPYQAQRVEEWEATLVGRVVVGQRRETRRPVGGPSLPRPSATLGPATCSRGTAFSH